jgi:glycosyltransferase involved in cell wall biosynthesis
MQRVPLADPTPDSSARPGWALVAPWDPSIPGGVSQVVLNLANLMKEQGIYRPIVIVREWAAKRPTEEQRNGILYIFIQMRSPPNKAIAFFGRSKQSVLQYIQNRRVFRLIRGLNIQVINFHWPDDFSAEPFLVKPYVVSDRQLKTIFSLHGMDIAGSVIKGSEFRERYVRMLARGDAIVAVSRAFANSITNTLAPELTGHVSVIYNGVCKQTIENHVAIELPVPNRYILNVGTFERKKGQVYLIEAFSRISGYYPDMHLVLVGRTAEMLHHLTQHVALLNLKTRVLFLQDVPHEKMGGLFASATLFCLSSLVEPFGIVLLEAGIFGLPVIATRVGGIPEIIRDNQDGILVSESDSAQLAASIRALLDAPDRAAALGASLRERVIAKFSWRRAAEQYVALARSLE